MIPRLSGTFSGCRRWNGRLSLAGRAALSSSSPLRLSGPRPSSSRQSRSFSSTCLNRAVVPFKLHDIGEGITEVEMLKWVVEEGQTVDHFDDLCEVQSDKSTYPVAASLRAKTTVLMGRAELTSPVPGVVHSIKVHAGDMVKVGQTLCEIRTDEPGGEDPDEHNGAAAETSKPHDDATTTAISTEDTESSVGDRPLEVVKQPSPPVEEEHQVSSAPPKTSERRPHQYAEEEVPITTGVEFSGEAAILPAAPAPAAVQHDQPVPTRRAREEEGSRKIILTSPAVRSLAGKLGLDLADIRGTGERGRITRQDVESYIATSSNVSNHLESSSGQQGVSHQQHAPVSASGNRGNWDEMTRVPFGRTRKVMYRALAAQAQVPHFGYSHTLDLTPLAPYLKALNPPQESRSPQAYLAADIPSHLVGVADGPSRQKTTLLSLLVKSMLLAMEEHPVMRAKVVEKDSEKMLEIRRDGIIGIAVSDPKNGLVTPSLPPINPSTRLSSITSAITQLRQNPTKMGTSANVVISSVGGLGEAASAMPVIPPGGPIAICAVGQAKWEVEWNLRDGGMKLDGEEVERGGTRAVLRCTVGWSGDHRVLEGAELIAFTESWKKYIEQPWKWLSVD